MSRDDVKISKMSLVFDVIFSMSVKSSLNTVDSNETEVVGGPDAVVV